MSKKSLRPYFSQHAQHAQHAAAFAANGEDIPAAQPAAAPGEKNGSELFYSLWITVFTCLLRTCRMGRLFFRLASGADCQVEFQLAA